MPLANEALERWLDDAEGRLLPLPPQLRAFYGPLRMPVRPDRPHVVSNFVGSLDGVAVLDPPHGTGADISGRNLPDRAVMGLLRACADAVVVGAGTLRAEPRHLWTAEHVCPELAPAYGALRAALHKPPAPLHVVVTAGGDVDLSLPVFSGQVPLVLVTTRAGALRLEGAAARAGLRVLVPEAEAEAAHLSARALLEAADTGPGSLVLLECGPTLTAQFLDEGRVDELFLTVAPHLVGRGGGHVALGLAEGRLFRAGGLWARLLSARRGGSFLFLRYLLNAPPTLHGPV